MCQSHNQQFFLPQQFEFQEQLFSSNPFFYYYPFQTKHSTVDEEKKKINQNQTELDEWKVTSTLDDGGVDASGFTAYYI